MSADNSDIIEQIEEHRDDAVLDDELERSVQKVQIDISHKEAQEIVDIEKGDFTDEVLDTSELVNEYRLSDHVHVQILYNSQLNEQLYRVVEPELYDLEKVLRMKVSNDIEEDFQNQPMSDLKRENIENVVQELSEKHIYKQRSFFGQKANKLIDIVNEKTPKKEIQKFTEISDENIDNVMYYINRDFAGYEKLDPLMNDKRIEDISCNGPDIPIFIYHEEHENMLTNIVYESEELDSFVASLAQRSGKNISIAKPNMQGRLPDGSRMQLTYSDEISDDGSNFTIRQFKDEPFTPVELIEYDTFSLEQMAYLWLAIENDQSLIFAGGTASGKTSSMNAISLFIPPRAKIVTIEDTREIKLRHANWIKSITRESFGPEGSGEVGMYTLLRDALRQRPEYIIVGEIRGSEATTLFQAMSTGHTTYSTMHADDVTAAVRRLENEPINVPRQMLNALDIISIQMRTRDKEGNIVRRCKEMVEIIGVEPDGEVKIRRVFEYDPKDDTIDYKGNSAVIENIKWLNNLSDREVMEEIDRRKRILKYIIDNVETRNYKDISNALRSYMQDKEKVMNEIEAGKLLQGK